MFCEEPTEGKQKLFKKKNSLRLGTIVRSTGYGYNQAASNSKHNATAKYHRCAEGVTQRLRATRHANAAPADLNGTQTELASPQGRAGDHPNPLVAAEWHPHDHADRLT